MKTLDLEVITPSKAAFSGKIESITVPGTIGNFQVLYNHAPILSSLEIGFVKIIEAGGKETKYTVSGGTVEVLDNKVLLLVESFESPEEIDVKRAEESLQRAKERLSKSTSEKIDITRAEASLKRAINRLKLKGAN